MIFHHHLSGETVWDVPQISTVGCYDSGLEFYGSFDPNADDATRFYRKLPCPPNVEHFRRVSQWLTSYDLTHKMWVMRNIFVANVRIGDNNQLQWIEGDEIHTFFVRVRIYKPISGCDGDNFPLLYKLCWG